MAETVADVMAHDPVHVGADDSVVSAAQKMRDDDIGVVVVEDRGKVLGLLTDRDLAVRVIAERRALNTPVRDVYSSDDIQVVAPTTPLLEAAEVMRAKAVRRLPVVDHGRAVGIISLGDIAIECEPTSPLADISAAPGNT
jgi:CBS domain-containing protein